MNAHSILRYKLKRVCDAQWLEQARLWICLHRAGLVVAYPPRQVNSVYLDTLGMGSLCANLDGYCTRHKVRWWWCGQDVVGAEAYFELKSKDNLLSAKQRYRQRNPHIAQPQLQVRERRARRAVQPEIMGSR